MSISEDKGHSDRGVSMGVPVGVSISVIRIGEWLYVPTCMFLPVDTSDVP